MPDSDAPSRSEPPSSERTNLPVPVPRPSEVARAGGESWVVKALRALFGWKAGSIRQDLEVVLEAGAPADTGFSPGERTMLKNVLALRGRRVEDVMVPRADIVAVQQDIPLGELIKVFEQAAHSRLAVYNDTLDDPIGMVHIRDLIAYMAARAAVKSDVNAKRKKPFPAGLDLKLVDLGVPLSSTKIVREILFVPPSMPVIDLFSKMQAIRIHLSLVIDEYGGTEGLVSIEDIVEQVVGEIEDEHDEQAPPSLVRQRDGSFLADARTSIEDVVATLGAEFDVGDAAEEVDTLGGYLVTKVGRVPVRGELVPGPDDFEIEVVDADPRRVKRVRIYRRKNRLPEAARQAKRGGKSQTESTLSPAAAPVQDAAADQTASPADTAARPTSDPTPLS
jgi:CBS domain containing-hemolysin-like protein